MRYALGVVDNSFRVTEDAPGVAVYLSEFQQKCFQVGIVRRVGLLMG